MFPFQSSLAAFNRFAVPNTFVRINAKGSVMDLSTCDSAARCTTPSNLYVANKWFASSKLCSNCGHKYEKLKLNERKWTCKKCGVFHDRDVNAAKNLLNNLKNSVPVNDRDQGKTIFKKGRSKKSAEKPLAGVQLNELSNVINEAESEFLHQNDVI